jgi:hypothetical protein
MLIRRKNALKRTQGKAKVRICPDYFLKACQSELNPLSKIKTGKNIIKID